jgi:hypothetical protein
MALASPIAHVDFESRLAVWRQNWAMKRRHGGCVVRFL